jgi:5S rRNA maturation endonuclease (ribonuclease M5)
MNDATLKLIDALKAAGKTVKANGQDSYMAQCPAHDDGRPSLSVRKVAGQVLTYCFAGCTAESIVQALGMTMADLYDNPKGKSYEYRENGRVVRTVHRTPDKQFRQTIIDKGRVTLFDPNGGNSYKGLTVWLPEGEKDAELLASQGQIAVSAPMGASNWAKCDYSPLYEAREVIILADNDEPGMARAHGLYYHLKDKGVETCIKRAKVGKDITDHIVAGEGLQDLIEVTPEPHTGKLTGSQKPRQYADPADVANVANVSGDNPLSKADQADFAELLDTIEAWFRRYIYLVNERDYLTVTLWAVHTWFIEQVRTTPRLLIHSPVPESGKTTLLEHLEKLCRLPVRMANAGTPATITRLVATTPHTLLMDEADRTLNPKNEGIRELIAVLNGGYKYGAKRPVNVPTKSGGWEVEQQDTYAPVAIAGNSPHLEDDTRSRCITVRLLKDTQGRVHESDWEYIEADALDLGERIKQTTERHQEAFLMFRPDLPPSCRLRNKERWQPLKRVAALAGEQWATRTDAVILEDLEQGELERQEAAQAVKPSVQLLLDIRQVFDEGRDYIRTTDLIPKLKAINPELWTRAEKPLTAQGLGRMLSDNYGITATRNNEGRGYHRGQFAKQWEAFTSLTQANRQLWQHRQDASNGAEVAPATVPNLPAQNRQETGNQCQIHGTPTHQGQCGRCLAGVTQ